MLSGGPSTPARSEPLLTVADTRWRTAVNNVRGTVAIALGAAADSLTGPAATVCGQVGRPPGPYPPTIEESVRALRPVRRRPGRQHPAGQARAAGQGRRAAGAGQGRVRQSGRVGQGPDRAEDDHAAEESGELVPGGTIVEPTSGNTGVGLALVAQQRGYHCIFVCPDKVSEDKRNVLRAYGAEVVVCPTAVAPEDPNSYYSVSDRLVRETPSAWKPNQYANPQNPASHYETTGPGDLGRHRRQGHPFRRRCRHRRHHLRHRPVPQGRLRRPGAGDRRRPGGLGVLRRHRAAVSGRGCRRGLLAGCLRPDRHRRDHRGLRRRVVRGHPAAGPGGGPAGRWFVRDGRCSRAAAGRAR